MDDDWVDVEGWAKEGVKSVEVVGVGGFDDAMVDDNSKSEFSNWEIV